MIRKSVGMQLRYGRELKKLSLYDLEALTGISPSYLLAMEMDQFSLLPSKAYEISYIKKYAQAIDIDQDELLRDYHMAVAEKQERQSIPNQKDIPMPPDYHSYSRTKATQKARSHRQVSIERRHFNRRLILMVLSLFFLVIVVTGIAVFWKNSTWSQSNQEKEIVSETTSSSSLEVLLPVLSVEPSPDGIYLNASLSNIDEPVTINLDASKADSERWFSVANSDYASGVFVTQDNPVLQVSLLDEATETTIVVGNTSGVSISINDQELDLSSLLPNGTAYITLTIE